MYYNYKVIIEECEEGGYYAECPAFPGCHVEGDTYEQTISELKEAQFWNMFSMLVEALTSHALTSPANELPLNMKAIFSTFPTSQLLTSPLNADAFLNM